MRKMKYIKTILSTIILYSLFLALNAFILGEKGIYTFINLIMPLLTGFSLIILGVIFVYEAFDSKKLQNDN